MKHIFKTAILAGALFVTACKVNTTAGPEESRPQAPSKLNWPTYERSTLAGTVFGKKWIAGTAVYSSSMSDSNQIVITMYGEKIADACKSLLISNLPFATIHLPKKLEVKEYIIDLSDTSSSEKAPLVFSTFVPKADNLMADKTKVQIDSVSDAGFKALIYAQATDETGEISEINGAFEAVNCEKAVPFSYWKNLNGGYYLKYFDGKPTASHYVRIESDFTSIKDSKTQTQLEMVELPLLYSVSSNSTASYNFGPISSLGTTIKKIENGLPVTIYNYNGPARFRGTDITLIIEVKMTEVNSSLQVAYTLEIPGQIPKASHSFEMSK